MKQYLLTIYQPDTPPPSEVTDRMDQIMANVNAVIDEAKRTGAWVFNGALHPPSSATVVRVRRGEMLLTDGPHTEGKEHIGGFMVVRAQDLDAALDWGRKLAGALGNDMDSLPVEVRPFQGAPEES
jgi:hypothetical protein